MTISPTANQLTDDGFDRIVAGLYDAATGGRAWDTALEPIRQVFGARTVVLHTTDLVDGRLLSLEAVGERIEGVAYDYVANWERRDPRKQVVLQRGAAGIGQWLHSNEFHDAAFRRHNAFYRHFVTGVEIGETSLKVIGLDERTVTGFSLELHASRGPLDSDERELARRMGVHLARALQGRERFRRLQALSLIGHQLLESFGYPMWLLAADREVQFANPAALSVEVQEQPVRRLQGRLRLSGPADDRRLSVLLHELAQSAHHTRRPLRLADPGGGDAAWLHLSVLDPAQVMGQAFGAERCFVATLFSPSQVSALDPFALAQMFELTPAEARVATLLGEGLELAAIAERLNVRLTTVRTHVRSVLAALGQKRTVDVVRVLREGQALWSVAQGSAPDPKAPRSPTTPRPPSPRTN